MEFPLSSYMFLQILIVEFVKAVSLSLYWFLSVLKSTSTLEILYSTLSAIKAMFYSFMMHLELFVYM